MSALFDLHTTDAPEFATTPNLSAAPSNISQRWSATIAEASAPDHFYNFQKAQAERYGKIIDDIHTMTGERLANPATNDATMEEIRENWGQPYPMIFQKRLDKLTNKAREVRSALPEGGYATEPGFLDPSMVNTQIAAESRGTREAAAKLEDTGGGAGALAGSFVGSFQNPFNILATFIPATRAPAWLSEQAVGLFLKNVGREALYQGATQAGAQAVSSAVEYGTRKPLGTEQTAGEIAGEIGGAAVFGAAIGGVARGAVPAWLKVRRMWGAGEYVPTAVKDAAITLEGKAIYGEKNPLGLTASSNESALDKAVQDVALGRPADVSNIVQFPTAQAVAGAAPSPTVQAAAAVEPSAAAAAGAAPTPSSTGRGEGVQYHGTSQSDLVPSGTHYSSLNYYGQGFYTTDAQDVAFGYSRAGSKTTGERNVYRVDERTGLSLYDAEKPIPPEVAAAIGRVHDFNGEPIAQMIREAKDEGKDLNLRQLYDELRDFGTSEGHSADTIQETFDSLNEQLRGLGYDGMTHTGGLKTGAAEHRVVIYFNPESDVALTRVTDAPEIQRLQKMADDIEKAPPTQPRPVAPTPEQPAGVAKPPGESPEDKAMLDQAKQMIESPEVAVPPEKRAAYNEALKQEQEAKVAAGCLAGAI